MGRTIKTIGVIGAGAMGRGIIQLFAQAGHKVRFFDVGDGAVDAAKDFVESMLNRLVEKSKISSDDCEQFKANLLPSQALEDLSDCDVVVEAIVENIDIKRDLFAKLEGIVSKSAILASNTSSLVIADIAAACQAPERVAGLHFFNPVPLMKVAEIISAVRTSPETVETLKALIDGTGHRAVIAADQPGFLVNHAGRGLYTEGLRILEESVASPAEVDLILREAAGFRMGPFELLDLTGLDVSGKVMESIYAQFHQEPRFKPSALVRPRVSAGLYGRKTGEGWYKYENNKKVEPGSASDQKPTTSASVWIDPDADQTDELRALAKSAGGSVAENPNKADLNIIQPWGIDASEACLRAGLDPSRTVAVDPLPGLSKRRTLMLMPASTADAREAALAILSADDGSVSVINDSCGFVVQRVLATIVNIACDIAQRSIASVDDIEASVKLGLGYPEGPLSWGDKIGPDKILEILSNIHALSGDPRYRPSPWLRRRVAISASLKSPEVSRYGAGNE